MPLTKVGAAFGDGWAIAMLARASKSVTEVATAAETRLEHRSM
jgi:hypothetical protein